MVRILAISDEELDGYAERLRTYDTEPSQAIDLLLAAGDLPWAYIEDIAGSLGVPAGFVPGNHDPATADGAGPRGLVNCDGDVVRIAGLGVAGLGGCVRYRSGPHQYTQQEFAVRAAELLESADRQGEPVDVLLTHAPPRGLGDASDPAHQGIEALHGVISRLRPAWNLHGHLHPFGMAKPDHWLADTCIRNVIPWQIIEVEPQTSQHHRTSQHSRHIQQDQIIRSGLSGGDSDG